MTGHRRLIIGYLWSDEEAESEFRPLLENEQLLDQPNQYTWYWNALTKHLENAENWSAFQAYCIDRVLWSMWQSRTLEVDMDDWFTPELHSTPDFLLVTRFLTEKKLTGITGFAVKKTRSELPACRRKAGWDAQNRSVQELTVQNRIKPRTHG